MSNITVYLTDGETVNVEHVAGVEVTPGQVLILRDDKGRTLAVFAREQWKQCLHDHRGCSVEPANELPTTPGSIMRDRLGNAWFLATRGWLTPGSARVYSVPGLLFYAPFEVLMDTGVDNSEAQES